MTYEHRLIDDMVAATLKWEDGFIWTRRNNDGEVQPDAVAPRFGSSDLMTPVSPALDDDIVEAKAAHDAVTCHDCGRANKARRRLATRLPPSLLGDAGLAIAAVAAATTQETYRVPMHDLGRKAPIPALA